MSVPKDALERFYNLSEEAFTSILSGKGIVLIHHQCGAVSETQVGAIVDEIEAKVAETVDNRSMIKRFFLVFVELLQNVVKHGATDEKGKAPVDFFIYLREGRLITTFSNVVEKGEAKQIESRFREVNRMNRDELKEAYMNQLTMGELSEKSGAGLGVMTVVLRSKNKSEVSSESISLLFDKFTCSFFIDP